MIFRQVIHEDLGCASYLIGDEKAGVAAVVDPRFDIEEYLRLARYLGVRIEHVFETHNHADHVSGHGRLAVETGARIHIHRLVAPDFPHDPFTHGDDFTLGALRVSAIHTPGHRPEHTSFLLTDTHRGEEPWALLSGDSLFVADVARPDLAVEKREGAREIFHSLHERLLTLPEQVEIWPGHLGGSMCGGPGMDSKGSSTIGFEQRHNAMLQLTDEDEFIEQAVTKLGAQPPNFKVIVDLNHGPLWTESVELQHLSCSQAHRLADAGALIIDVRDELSFAEGHIPGALWIPLNKSGFGTKLAWLTANANAIVFAAEHVEDGERAATLAAAVGLAEQVRRGGILGSGPGAWLAAGEELAQLRRLSLAELDARLDSDDPIQVLDARERAEYEAGHLPDSVCVPWHDLTGVPDVLDPARPVAVICAAGLRAGVAAAVLQHHGADVFHVVDGGVPRWASLGGSLRYGPESAHPALA